jgi:hypothetical protein
MAELKTKANEQSVTAFLEQVEDEQKRQDCFKLVELMSSVTGAEAKMWGDAIIGFGEHHYKYESGRENDWFLTGFSPRKKEISLYIMGSGQFDGLISKLGKHKMGKSCLYVNKLNDIDLSALRELVEQSVEYTKTS